MLFRSKSMAPKAAGRTPARASEAKFAESLSAPAYEIPLTPTFLFAMHRTRQTDSSRQWTFVSGVAASVAETGRAAAPSTQCHGPRWRIPRIRMDDRRAVHSSKVPVLAVGRPARCALSPAHTRIHQTPPCRFGETPRRTTAAAGCTYGVVRGSSRSRG